MALHPTEMELALLRLFYDAYRDRGFPPPEDLTIVDRTNTGTGRFVKFAAGEAMRVNEVALDIDCNIVVPGLKLPMGVFIPLAHGRPDYMELCCNHPEDEWNGDEEGWQIVRQRPGARSRARA